VLGDGRQAQLGWVRGGARSPAQQYVGDLCLSTVTEPMLFLPISTDDGPTGSCTPGRRALFLCPACCPARPGRIAGLVPPGLRPGASGIGTVGPSMDDLTAANKRRERQDVCLNVCPESDASSQSTVRCARQAIDGRLVCAVTSAERYYRSRRRIVQPGGIMPGAVRLVHGDMFDGPSDLIVLPCATGGSVTAFVAERMKRFTLPRVPAPMLLGDVRIVPLTEASNVAQCVGLRGLGIWPTLVAGGDQTHWQGARPRHASSEHSEGQLPTLGSRSGPSALRDGFR
jgi:hypothetical protein